LADKLYLRDFTVDNPGGTLPGGTNIAGLTINVTATGASTNRAMTEGTGAGQTSAALTTAAQSTAQTNWFRRWCSRRLAAQSIAAQTITLSFAASESAAQSDMFENGRWFLALWRPSTGAIVTTMINDTALITEPGTGQTAISKGLTSTAATAQGGDILVLELFSAQSQSNATARTNTIFYDGVTEASATDCASFIQFATDVVQMQTHQQPVNYASTAVLMKGLRRAWHRRPSGIFLPDYEFAI
jgi:hypothetical protein